MKKLVLIFATVLTIGLTACHEQKPANQDGNQDQTCNVTPAPEGEVEEAVTTTEANAEAGNAAVTEEKKDAPAEAPAAPAENAEKK